MARIMRGVMQKLAVGQSRAPHKKCTKEQRQKRRFCAFGNARFDLSQRTYSHHNLRVGPREKSRIGGQYCPFERQVSWLAGRKSPSAFPVSQWLDGRGLTALQSRGRLRSKCPDWVHPFAFPFDPWGRARPFGNHSSSVIGAAPSHCQSRMRQALALPRRHRKKSL